MFRVKYISLLIFLSLFTMQSMSDQAFAGSSKRSGTAGAQELLIPVGSIGSALNGANQALSTGTEAIFWNPAGIARTSSNSETMFSRLNYIAGLDMTYFAAMVKFEGLGAFAFSLRNLDFGEIIRTTEEFTDGTGETFSPTYITVGLSWSKVMTDRIGFGVTVKIISEQIMRESAKGLALDIGVQYSSGVGGYRLGVVMKNLGPNMKFDGPDLEDKYQIPGTQPGTNPEPRRISLQSFELPSTLELGVGYEFIMSEQNSITLSGDFLNNNFSLDEIKIGAEYSMNDILFLRGGYNVGYNSDALEGEGSFTSSSESLIWGPSFGAGLHYDVSSDLTLNIDYAYQTTEFFNDNQWLTLTVLF